MPMDLKLGKMLTYLKGLLSIKSYDHIITLSCKIMWQIIFNIFINTISMQT